MNAPTKAVPVVPCSHDRRTVATAPVVCVALLALGVASVRVDFDGAHGKGSVGPVEFFDATEPAQAVLVPEAVQRQVTSLFTALLACLCPRWDLGLGSYGFFKWQLATRQLIHEYRPRLCARTSFAFPITAIEMVALDRPWPPL